MLEAILDDATAAALAAQRGEGAANPASVELLAAALDHLADRVSAGALPVTPPLPDDPMLGDAVAQVRTATEIARRQARVRAHDALPFRPPSPLRPDRRGRPGRRSPRQRSRHR